MSSNSESRPATTHTLEQFSTYPFNTDETYQQGLASILAVTTLSDSDDASPDEREELMRRIRVFYFNKATGNSITADEVRAYEQSLNTQQGLQLGSSPSTAPEETTASVTPLQTNNDPKVLSFAEIKELIEAGRLDEIPNNKVIPDSLNQETPSDSVAPARKKPWEIVSKNQTDTPQNVEV